MAKGESLQKTGSAKQIKEVLAKIFLWLCAIISVACLVMLLVYIISRGLPYISWQFLSTKYAPGLDFHGILPIIAGTLAMIGLSLLIGVPLGIMAAIYTTQYAKQGRFLQVLRFATESLAGIPSILYGLFGATFFVVICQFKISLLSGALTIAIMILPVIIRTTEEALLTVPASYREGSLALGANLLTTLRRIVLPCAIPGIVTAVILSIGRVIGETAALYFTSGTAPDFPQGLGGSVRTLSIHLYLLAKEGTAQNEAFATACVLLVIILGLNLTAQGVASLLSRKLSGK